MRADVAAVQGVVPRRLEFRQNLRKLNNLPNLGVQLGYDYNSDWTPLLAGLSPIGMAASLAAAENDA